MTHQPAAYPYTGHPDQHFGSTTFSQQGEDLMLMNLFKLFGFESANGWPKTTPFWLDIGAHHPVNISNTALLYSRGFRGVNVEANPTLIKAFNEQRPEDVNCCLGVGPVAGDMHFYMFDEKSGRNTFDHGEALRFSRESGREIQERLTLQVVTISEIVERHCGGRYPPLLTIDIEGLDYEVLRSADFTTSRPMVICVESRKEDTRIAFMLEERWGFSKYCRMGENLLFVHSDNKRLVY